MRLLHWSTVSGLGLWIGCLLGGFYLFFWQYIGPFDPDKRYPDNAVATAPWLSFLPSLAERAGAAPGQTLVLHWLDLDCPCSRYAGGYIERLLQNDTGDTVQRVVLPSDQLDLLPASLRAHALVLSEEEYKRSQALLPAAPAATVYREGEISYIGPHSAGTLCGQGESFIELVLKNLAQGYNSALYNFAGQRGCFCRW